MTAAELQIIQQLIEKTRARNAAWETTSARDQFALKMKSGTVILDYFEKERSFQLQILNKSGAAVTNVSAKKTDEHYNMLAFLWDQVVESYFRIEETLKNVLNELKTSNEVGDEDNLPF